MRSYRVIVGSVIIALVALSLQTTTAFAAPIAPNFAAELDDYAPGSLVLLEGTGWQSNEDVHVVVNDDLGQIWRYETDVIASDTGVLQAEVQLPNTFVANYVVQASGASGSTAFSTFTDAASKSAQTAITVTAPVPTSPATSFPVFTTGLQISYTGGSGTGAVTYSVSVASDACKINNTDATKLDIIHGQGTCVVKVTKASDASYLATNGTLSVNTSRIAQTSVKVTGPTQGTFDQTLPIGYTGGTGTGAVTYSVTPASDACAINALDQTKVDIIHGTGTCAVKVSKAADVDYLINADSQSIAVAPAAQSPLTVTGPTAGALGQSLPITSTGGSGTGAVTYSVSSRSDSCAINGTDSTKVDIVHGLGTCVIKATKAADADYQETTSSLTVDTSRVLQTPITVTGPTEGTFGQSLPITYTGGSGNGELTYSVSDDSDACTINDLDPTKLDIIHGTGTCTVKVAKANDADYFSDADAQSVALSKASQTPITITSPTTGTFGDTLPISYTGGSGSGAVTYSVSEASDACAINATDEAKLDILHGSGTCVVLVSKAGDDDYKQDTDRQSVNVTKVTQNQLTVTGPTDGTYGDTALPITYTGGSGSGAVSFSVGDSDSCALNANDPTTLDITAGEGTCEITVSKATDADYFAASSDDSPDLISALFKLAPTRFAVRLNTKTSPDPVHWNNLPTDATYGDSIDLTQYKAGGAVSDGVIDYVVGENSTSCVMDGASTLKFVSGVGYCGVRVIQRNTRNYKRSADFANINSHRATARDVTVAVNGSTTPVTYYYGDTDIPVTASWGGTGSGTLHIETNSLLTTGCSVSNAVDSNSPTASLSITTGSSGTCRVRTVEQRNDFYHVDYDGVWVRLANRPITVSAVTDSRAYTGGTDSTGAPTVSLGSLAAGDTLSGCSQSFNSADAGSGKTLTPSGCSIIHTDGSVDQTANYTINYSPVTTGTITAASQSTLIVTAPTAGSYGDKLTPSSSGGDGTGAVTFTASGTACAMGTAADLGKVVITAGTGTCAVTAHKGADTNYNAADSAPLNVTVGKTNQATLTVTNPTSGTYGDKLALSASGGSTAASPTFTASGTACLVGTGPDSGKLLITAGTGTCTVTAHKAGNDNYNIVDSAPANVTTANRTATVGYTGGQLWQTGSLALTSTLVTLSATVTTATGSTANLANATVDFLIYSSVNTAMITPDLTCSAPVNSAGVATCTKSLGVDNWTVVVSIPITNAYFTALVSDPAVVTVYLPSTDRSARGNGWIIDAPATTPAQPYRGTFGFNLHYRDGKSGSPEGQFVYTYRAADGYDYVVKSTSWVGGGLAFGSVAGTSTFTGKATVTRIRRDRERTMSYYDRDRPTERPGSAPNYTFRVDVADKSTGDTFALSVYSNSGVLYHQAGTTATQIKISGGNILVK